METFLRVWRYLPGLLGLGIAVAAQVQLSRWLLEWPATRRSAALRRSVRVAAGLFCAWVFFGFLLSVPRFAGLLPRSWWLAWVRGGALAWACASLGALAVLYLWRRLPRFQAGRRGFLRAAGGAVAAVPFAAVGFGVFVQRNDFRIREIKVPIPGLPKDLEGLRLVQLSDIHLSPFLSQEELARAVGMANELKPHLALVTGDLITAPGDPLEACLRGLSKLRAEAGILGCLGNHETYAGAEDHATRLGARLGIQFLRQQSRRLRFSSSLLNVVGVDYQRLGRPYLPGADRALAPGAVNILLSHNPDVFPVAANQGYDLTVSGHTHGGQVTVEILSQALNIARFFTPYVYGLYRQGRASVYVTRGIGTVGVPARIGAPPEIVLLRLCAT
jgi:hypothetical protein